MSVRYRASLTRTAFAASASVAGRRPSVPRSTGERAMVKTLAGEAFGASGEAGAGEGRARRDDFKAGTTGLKIGWRRDQRNRGRANSRVATVLNSRSFASLRMTADCHP